MQITTKKVLSDIFLSYLDLLTNLITSDYEQQENMFPLLTASVEALKGCYRVHNFVLVFVLL